MDHTSFDSGASPIYSDQDHRSDESQSVIDPGGSQSVIDPGGSQSVIDLGGTSMEGNEEVIPSENANDANDERALTLTGEEADVSGDKDGEPYEGMEFESQYTAYKFYNDYARRMGFGVRWAKTGRSRRNREVIGRDIYCFRQGRTPGKHDGNARQSPVTRIGCKALLRLKKVNSEKWVVSKFVKEHCHDFLAPDKVGLIRSHRRILDDAKSLIDFHTTALLEPSQMMSNSEAQAGGLGNGGSTQRDRASDESQMVLDPSGFSLGVDGEVIEHENGNEADICAVEDVEPYEGMEFDSEDAAYKFYNAYARLVGFGTRRAKTRRSRTNSEIIGRDFYCWREGRRDAKHDNKRRHRAQLRVGCMAMLRVKRAETGKWVISKFVKDHCHKFLAPDKIGLIRSHRRISDDAKKLLALYASAMSKRPQLMSKEQAGGSGSTQENEDEDEEPVQEGEPYVGMEFDTEYAAYKFYTDYARHVGFGTRWAKTRRSRANKEVIARDIYCFRQGKRKPKRDANVRDGKVRQRPHSRIGCKAMIRIKKSNNGKWVISSFVKKHCHKFLTPGEVGFTRMRKRIFDPSGDLIDLYNEERAGVSGNVDQGDCQNYLLSKKLKGQDAMNVLGFFNDMHAKNPSFFYRILVNEEGHIISALWVEARSRISYKHFNDLIIFDTTYQTCSFKMPFASIIGINHHNDTMFFGGALIHDESVDTFEWVFIQWLQAMNNCHPKAIVTDEDPAIAAAIAKVFPWTRHRFCKWHLLGKYNEKLGHIDRKHPSFRDDFMKCIGSQSVEEFEACWSTLMDKYGVQENEWLQRLLNCQSQWVDAYFQDTFLAGTVTSQRFEEIHYSLKRYVKSTTSLHTFITAFQKLVDKKFDEENTADHKSLTETPVLRTPFYIEKQASKIYTLKMFDEFQRELIKSTNCFYETITEDAYITTFKLVEHGFGTASHLVTFDASEVKVSCSCHKYDKFGILCGHVLRVFSLKHVVELPSHYILKRWTMEAKREEEGIEIQAGSQAPRTIRHDVLCQLVNQITEDGAISEDLYEFTRLCLSRLAVEVAERKKLVTNNQPVSSNQASLSLDAGFQAMEIEPQSLTREPSRSNSRGRPPKNNTKCNVCKGTGHNRRTCPIVRGGGSNLNIGIGMVGTEINLDENQISQICTGDEMPAVQILSWGQI
ncbi:protein FAR1-RELATED SEQUENCE 7 [Amborella trichopoda]|uniref:protein FAR1-RELATED SEQUENCE 7 n=1 Tax=Amborella trichopoda TaxID=13333 RepID=UPI0005D2EEF4|nr:protein FAR1-RELATED SEQUENCE 7 [Amborella trichopoda]|eukprot:XP_011626980.1 protein FAR1-RELATED SEQUENCE 7 [Amborella trichopoda]